MVDVVAKIIALYAKNEAELINTQKTDEMWSSRTLNQVTGPVYTYRKQ
jgi:hypothetical protein